MGTERHILRLLLAAILVIAAQFLPSVASAHDGHGHGAHQATVPAHTVASIKAHDGVSIAPSAGIAARVWANNRTACAPGCLACAGGTACCGCGAMILPAAVGLPQRAAFLVAVAAPDVPTPTGIGPEALPEPPKPNA